MSGLMPGRIGPKLGKKQIFLPNFVLTLLHTPNLPPTFASFIVPLNLHKLDLRDYLWNVYGVNVRGVRSFIQQQKVQQDRPGAVRPAPRKWFRPRSIKKMMVELDRPFVWPEEPKDFSSWDKETYAAAQKDRKEYESTFDPQSRQKPSKERGVIAEQAKALLQGREGWKPSQETPGKDKGQDPDDGFEEVEKDIVVPRVQR